MRHSTCCFVLTLLLVTARLATAEPAVQLQGAWRNDDKEPSLIHFQPGKCLLYEKGRLQVFTAKYEPDKLTLGSMGQKAVWKVEAKANQVVLTMADGHRKLALKKLDSVPP